MPWPNPDVLVESYGQAGGMRAEKEKEFSWMETLQITTLEYNSYFVVIDQLFGSGLEVPSCPEPEPFGDNAAMQSVLVSIPPFPKLGPYTLLPKYQ